MIEFDFNKLNNLRIHELRDFARNVGVKSPTSLKKEEIIEQVLLILSGESQPYVNLTKQGRPAKSQQQLDQLVDLFVPKNSTFDVQTTPRNYELFSDDRFELLANAPAAAYNEPQQKSTKVKGYLDIHKNGYGILRVKCFVPNGEDVFLHMYSIKTNNLLAGDLLEGEAKLVQIGRPMVLTNITSVNGKPVSTYAKRKLFASLPYTKLEHTIKFHQTALIESLNEVTVLEGSRNLLLHKNKFNHDKLVKIMNSFNTNEYEIILLNLNAMPEDQEHNAENVIWHNVGFNVDYSVVISCTQLVVEVAKRKLEDGKKVVLVLNNLTTYLKALLHMENPNNFGDITPHVISTVKNLVMCAKNVNNENNLTLFVLEGLHLEEKMLHFIQYDFANIFNNTCTIVADKVGNITVTKM